MCIHYGNTYYSLCIIKGVRYLEGGVKSGFNHYDPDEVKDVHQLIFHGSGMRIRFSRFGGSGST